VIGVKVQLATDLAKMPVEDASARWPEDESPYVPVGWLVARPTWCARTAAYAIATNYRQAQEQRPTVEPNGIGELPD
jgi:hypothetical protein